MLKRKSLAVATAALLASAMTVEPVLAQYSDRYDDYNRDRQSYDQQLQEYNERLSQYERERAQYDSNYRGGYDYRDTYNYDYRDDAYARDCGQQRAGNQVGGLIVGAIAGGLLGSTIARGPARGSGTAIGAILGGALGANIGGNLNCEDRSYVYRTYYDGFERGIPRTTYRWRNDRTGNYGDFTVNDYYRNRDGIRCAHYTQTIWVRGRPVPATGEACRQRDGNWVIIS